MGVARVYTRVFAVMVALGLPEIVRSSFNISNTLGDGMVLQRRPQQAVVWGFANGSTTSVSTLFLGQKLGPAAVDAAGIWRQKLPATDASADPTTITFTSNDGQTGALNDVLFGDVFLCSGQSNMQYTPHSMAGMNNLSAELAAADNYGDMIRFFTVGMQTDCSGSICAKPFNELNPNVPVIPPNGTSCRGGHSCREAWGRASSAALGGQAWNTFSAVCWLTGRDIHNALGGTVPIGLISSNWGGTPVQVWQGPPTKVQDCIGNGSSGVLYNSMIAPFAVGPMALRGATWYQGESNVGAASYYACAFPTMIQRWRHVFQNPTLWFGFVQIAGFAYSHPYGKPPRPEIDHSHAAGDLRQAQLAALRLPNVGMTTAIDTGDWTNIHPPDKQNPASRLANQALNQIYGMSIPGTDFPMYGGSAVTVSDSIVTVKVTILAGGKPVALTTKAPIAATQSSTLGKGVSIPRNMCVTSGITNTFPQDCGYPTIWGTNETGLTSINATASIADDGSTLILTANRAGIGNFVPFASSYGRASWPMTVFFATDGANLPVLPWFANFSTSDPYTPPLKWKDLGIPIKLPGGI